MRRGALRPPGIQKGAVRRRIPHRAVLMAQPHQTPMMPYSLSSRALPAARRLVTSLPQGLGPAKVRWRQKLVRMSRPTRTAMPLEPKRWRRPPLGGGVPGVGESSVMAGVTLGGCCYDWGDLSNKLGEGGVTTEGTEGHRGFWGMADCS